MKQGQPDLQKPKGQSHEDESVNTRNPSKGEWWQYITAVAVIIGILGSLAEFLDYINIVPNKNSSIASNTVTVLVHGEDGKDQLILPNRGIVKLIFGDAIIPKQINNIGEATFKQVPEDFFQRDAKVEILFQDPEGEPYRAMHYDSLYQLTKSKYIALPVKLYGLGQIWGYVRDAATGQPIAGARISVQGENTFSDKTGYYDLEIPLEKQRQFQSIRCFRQGYEPREFQDVPVQTGREIPILMKTKTP